jgi:hypothetical protein
METHSNVHHTFAERDTSEHSAAVDSPAWFTDTLQLAGF